MARLKVSVVIARPAREVWRYLEQIERHHEWMRDCVGIRFVGRSQRGVGTRFVADTRVLGLRMADEMEIVEWRPRRAMGVTHSGMVTGTGTFRLRRARGGGTRFTWDERLHFSWFLGGPAGAYAAVPVLKFIWRRSLRDLKSRLEA